MLRFLRLCCVGSLGKLVLIPAGEAGCCGILRNTVRIRHGGISDSGGRQRLLVQLELADHFLQDVCLAGQFLTCSSGLLSGSRGGLDNSRDLLDTNGHLGHSIELIGRCAGDLHHAVIDSSCLSDNAVECLGSGVGKAAALGNSIQSVLDQATMIRIAENIE